MAVIKNILMLAFFIPIFILIRTTIFVLEIFSKALSFTVEKVNDICNYILQKI